MLPRSRHSSLEQIHRASAFEKLWSVRLRRGRSYYDGCVERFYLHESASRRKLPESAALPSEADDNFVGHVQVMLAAKVEKHRGERASIMAVRDLGSAMCVQSPDRTFRRD